LLHLPCNIHSFQNWLKIFFLSFNSLIHIIVVKRMLSSFHVLFVYYFHAFVSESTDILILFQFELVYFIFLHCFRIIFVQSLVFVHNL
jgi:hypothetical protein